MGNDKTVPFKAYVSGWCEEVNELGELTCR